MVTSRGTARILLDTWAPTAVEKWGGGVNAKLNAHNKRFLKMLYCFAKK